jgi:glutathione peroxidase
MAKTIRVLGMLAAAAVMAVTPQAQGGAQGRGTSKLGFSFEFEAIEGGKLPLRQFAGRPVLVVNTASQCGYTPQYDDLQAVWSKYRQRGLVVVGVPSNDFGAQEPGSEAEIKQFCDVNFSVDFPMTAKQIVVDAAAHPFYRWIAAELGAVQVPRWNFYKYLIAPDGSIAGAWPSTVKPTEAKITEAIEKHLPR